MASLSRLGGKTQKRTGNVFKDKLHRRDIFLFLGQRVNNLHPGRRECLPELRTPALNPLSTSSSRVNAYPSNSLAENAFYDKM